MPEQSIEAQLAVLAMQFKFISDELIDAKAARKSQYEKQEEQGRTLLQMDGRMKLVEEALKTQAPTIEEFITIKHKVQGAGTAGKWIWSSVGAVLGMLGLIVAAKAGFISLLTGR